MHEIAWEAGEWSLGRLPFVFGLDAVDGFVRFDKLHLFAFAFAFNNM